MGKAEQTWGRNAIRPFAPSNRDLLHLYSVPGWAGPGLGWAGLGRWVGSDGEAAVCDWKLTGVPSALHSGLSVLGILVGREIISNVMAQLREGGEVEGHCRPWPTRAGQDGSHVSWRLSPFEAPYVWPHRSTGRLISPGTSRHVHVTSRDQHLHKCNEDIS